MRLLVILLTSLLPQIIGGIPEILKDGSCVTPFERLHASTPEEIARHWYVLSYNSDNPKLLNRKCYQVDAKVISNGHWLFDTKYKNEKNNDRRFTETLDVSYDTNTGKGDVPIDVELDEVQFPGKKYAVAGRDGVNNLLLHICKEVGNKHEGHYEIRSPLPQLPKEILEKLKNIARGLGDRREFIDVTHDNCN